MGMGDIFSVAGQGILNTGNYIGDLAQKRREEQQAGVDAETKAKLAQLDAILKGTQIQKGQQEVDKGAADAAQRQSGLAAIAKYGAAQRDSTEIPGYVNGLRNMSPKDLESEIAAQDASGAGDRMNANYKQVGKSPLEIARDTGMMQYRGVPEVAAVLKPEEDAAASARDAGEAAAAAEKQQKASFDRQEASLKAAEKRQQASIAAAEERAAKADAEKAVKLAREGIDPDTQKPYTANQSSAAGYAFRMAQADSKVSELYNSGFDMGKIGNAIMKPDKLNLIKDPAQRQYAQAARNFVNAVLRRESGAVISPSEFAEARAQYFPQIGEDATTQEQKRLNRMQTLAGVKATAGKAYDRVADEYERLTSGTPAQPAAKSSFDDLWGN